MSILYTSTKPIQTHRLRKLDHEYLKKQLTQLTVLSRLLNKPINQHYLKQLQCLLDKKPIPRRKSGQQIRGQMCRLSDGQRHPNTRRKMTLLECIRFGVNPAVLYKEEPDG